MNTTQAQTSSNARKSCFIKIDLSPTQTASAIPQGPKVQPAYAQCLRQFPSIKAKISDDVKPVPSPEVQIILNLRKIRPSVRPIKLSLSGKAKRDSKRATKIPTRGRNSGDMKISIPLFNKHTQNC